MAKRTHGSHGTLHLALVGVLGFSAVIALEHCQQHEGEPHAAAIERHGIETREVLENEAVRLARGPNDAASQQLIDELRSSGEAISRRARSLAGEIRKQPMARGGGPVMGRATLETIANTRCEVQANCGQIGSGRRFATPLTCSAVMQNDQYLGWNSASCSARPFDPDRLDRCLAAIRAETCDRMDSSEVAARDCRPDLVCTGH